MQVIQVPFLTETDIRPIRGTNKYKLDAIFKYQLKDGTIIVLQKDFVSDLASVPRLFWSLIPRDGRYRDAALPHDGGYGGDLFIEENNQLKLYRPKRRTIDRIMLELMRDPELNVKKWRRVAIYQAVRRFGWANWRRAKKKRIEFEKQWNLSLQH